MKKLYEDVNILAGFLYKNVLIKSIEEKGKSAALLSLELKKRRTREEIKRDKSFLKKKSN